MAVKDELSNLSKDIQAQEDKLKRMKEKKKRLEEANFTKLGKLVVKVFGNQIPETDAERKIWLENLKKLSVQPMNSGNMSVHSESIKKSGEYGQQFGQPERQILQENRPFANDTNGTSQVHGGV